MLPTDKAAFIVELPLLFTLAHRLERNVLTNFGLSVGTGVLIIGGALIRVRPRKGGNEVE